MIFARSDCIDIAFAFQALMPREICDRVHGSRVSAEAGEVMVSYSVCKQWTLDRLGAYYLFRQFFGLNLPMSAPRSGIRRQHSSLREKAVRQLLGSHRSKYCIVPANNIRPCHIICEPGECLLEIR